MNLLQFLAAMVFAFILPDTVSTQSPIPPLLFPPNYQILRISYKADSKNRWLEPGTKLHNKEASTPPQLDSLGLNLSCSRSYLIFLIDLDVILNATTATTILHWYQPNLVVSCNKKETSINPSKRQKTGPAKSRAPYIGPRAKGIKHHRYVFFLFEQPRKYRFPECFSHIFPEKVDARAGFDVVQFANVAGLERLVGINWFWGGDIITTSTAVATSTTPAPMTSIRVAPCKVTQPTIGLDMRERNQIVLE